MKFKFLIIVSFIGIGIYSCGKTKCLCIQTKSINGIQVESNNGIEYPPPGSRNPPLCGNYNDTTIYNSPEGLVEERYYCESN